MKGRHDSDDFNVTVLILTFGCSYREGVFSSVN